MNKANTMLRPLVIVAILLGIAGCHPGMEHAAFSSVRDNASGLVLRNLDGNLDDIPPAPLLAIPDFKVTTPPVTGGIHEQDYFTPAGVRPQTEFRHDYEISLFCNSGICGGQTLTGTAVLVVNTATRTIHLERIDASSADMAFHLRGALESEFSLMRDADFRARMTHAETSGVWTFGPVASSVFRGFDQSMPGIRPGTIEFQIRPVGDNAIAISGLAVPGDELQ